MYFGAIAESYSEFCELAGICDSNEGRLRMRLNWLKERGMEAKGYAAEDFDRMIAECKPDSVIVTTKDRDHEYYVTRAMELGCDAITEKPMTVDEVRCQRMIDTQRRTGKKLTVTFNYRYSPPRTQIKDLLMSGVIGNVVSVDFHWMLNTGHGADYFRRWHRHRENSGTLLVHKATHHFDVVNWWLSSVPEAVFARGARNFYTPHQADRYGLTNRTERCLDCPETAKCKFAIDLRGNEGLKSLYLDHEKYDGYFRDRCVFSSLIDIEDTMHLNVRYQSGAFMSYSLHAFMPWEGYVITFNGTKGRLEHTCQETVYISGDGTVPGALKPEGTWIRIYPHFEPAYEVDVWQGEGGHGGGDILLLDDLFHPNPPKDKYKRAADQRAGAYSILTGIAANHSIATGKDVLIDDLVKNIGIPDYTPMPSPDEAMPF